MRYFSIRSLCTGAIFSLGLMVACSTDPGSAPGGPSTRQAGTRLDPAPEPTIAGGGPVLLDPAPEPTIAGGGPVLLDPPPDPTIAGGGPVLLDPLPDPTIAGGGPVLLDPPPEPTTLKRAQYLMGTIAEITAVASQEAMAQEAVTAGFQEIRRLEQLLSTWIETSELSQVNRAAGREKVPVSPETFELLTRAVEMSALTGGAFDITVGPAVRLWKVTEGQRVPSAMELAIAAQYVDYRLIQLDSKNRTVFLPKPGMQIDVGSIGKGYGAERAAAAMQRTGASGGLVAIAGDIRTFGRRADRTAWPVGIQHPRKPDVLATLEASDEAVSTSGDYERFFFQNGVRYHHILNPRTLMPAKLCQSVTIVAPDATTADALATGVFVMGPVTGLALVERLKLGAIIVDAKGRMTVSSRLRNRIHGTPDLETLK